ncbi:hypothetical protein T4B_3747 [Trichinella pseudospiralis]|uniref:Uncharacterized protein n=1 Tax=Trichinella pseudospiralis TaxID=6337 RepID=A0A0V1I4D8_TRIPS|nr:hypothetical protein T4B_3747 [Trichinella pseudospiralis]
MPLLLNVLTLAGSKCRTSSTGGYSGHGRRCSCVSFGEGYFPCLYSLFVLHGVLFFVLLPLRTTLRARDPEVLLVRIWFSQTNQACLGVKYELLGFLDFTHVQAATKNAAAALSDGGHIVKKDDLRERDAGPGRRELL